jgi:hypothetical protein
MTHTHQAEGGHVRRLLDPWSDRAGLLALVVIVVQALWRGWHVTRGYFTQDDFVILDLAHDHSLGSLLFSDYYGHLLPARWLVAEMLVRGGELPWGVAAVQIIVLMVATSLLMWHTLTRLLPGSWARVPILAVFCFSPLTLWTTQQWIVAIQFFPVTILMLLSVLALVRHVREGWIPGAWLPVVLTAVALLFQERAILLPIAYAGIALIMVRGSFLGRVPVAVRTLWPTWLGLVAVVGGYFALHSLAAPIQARPLTSDNGDLVDLVANFVFRTALPGLLGGPWQPEFFGSSALIAPAYAVFLAVAAFTVLVVLTVRRSGPAAWWAWLMFGLYVVADVGILFGGKSQFGVEIGLISRYAADLTPVLALCLAAALADQPKHWLPVRLDRWSRTPTIALGLAGLALVSAVPTTVAVAPELENRDDRRYAESLSRQLAQAPETLVYDAVPPAGVLVPWFGDRARVSTVLGTVHPRPRYQGASSSVMVPDARGRLRQASVADPVRMLPSTHPQCGYPVSIRAVTIPLARPVAPGRHLMRVDFFSARESVLSVRLGTGAGGRVVRFLAGPGLGSVYVPVDGSFDSIVVHNDDPNTTVCVAQVAVGRGVPAL